MADSATGLFQEPIKIDLEVGKQRRGARPRRRKKIERTNRSPCSVGISIELASGSTSQYSRTLKCSYRLRFSSRSRAEVAGDRISITKSGGPWTFLSKIRAAPPWRTTNRLNNVGLAENHITRSGESCTDRVSFEIHSEGLTQSKRNQLMSRHGRRGHVEFSLQNLIALPIVRQEQVILIREFCRWSGQESFRALTYYIIYLKAVPARPANSVQVVPTC
jgi:hypothetical protein